MTAPRLRFRAVVERSGVNPYVEVPERVSRRLAEFARAGRIPVSGKLEGVDFRTTLVPRTGGRHWLFVNGGMRNAAGVEVGDEVGFLLSPVEHLGSAPPPSDLAAALRAAGLEESWRELSPSHRWQLIRYLEDARSSRARQRRIEKAVAQVAGHRRARSGSARSRARKERPAKKLWTCPKCGHSFVNKNQWHSCKRYRLDEVFAQRPPRIRLLFDRFREMVESCGPVELVAYRDRVGFMVRVRFAGASPKNRWLDVGFWLPERVESPRFTKIETIEPRAHIHRLRIRELEELDDEVAGWVRRAYGVGRQKHLES